MKEIITNNLTESARLLSEAQAMSDLILEAASLISASFSRGGRLLLFGNGGSAADAQHLAAEFVNRLLFERPALPAIALTTDTSILTSVANDYSFNDVFSKQVKALGRSGDVAWGLTTSGNSPNVLNALAAARDLGLKTVVMTGAGGGEARDLADVLLAVGSTATPRIQEVHIALGHIVCELVDHILFQRPGEGAEA